MALADYQKLIDAAAAQYGLDPALLRAQLSIEDASGATSATSPAGAEGPAQLMPATARAMGVNPRDPGAAIAAMAQIDAQNLKAYGGDVHTALMAYHGGPNQRLWGPKTRAYPDLVLKQMAQASKPAQPAVSAAQADAQALDTLPDLPAITAPTQGASGDTLPDLPALPVRPAQAQPTASASAVPTPGPLHPLEVAGSNLLRGGAAALGIPGDIEQWAINRLGAQDGKFLGSSTFFPTSEDLLAPLRARGLVDQASELPQNETERLLASAAGGVGAGIATLPIGGPEALSLRGAVGAVSTGAMGGLGAETAHELAPESSIAPVIGGLVGGSLAGTVANAGTRAANLLAGNWTPEAEAFAKLGVEPASPAYTVASPGTAKTLAPSAETAAAQAQDLGNAVEDTAAAIGPQRTLQQAGTVTQTEAQNWLDNTLPAKLKEAWAPIDQNVPPTLSVPLTGLDKALAKIQGQGGSLAGVINLLKSKLPAQIKTQLDTATLLKHPSWQDVSTLRTALGEARGIPDVVQSIGEKNLSRMYAALTGDMRSTLERLGSTKAEELGAYEAEPNTVLGGQAISPEQMAALRARIPDMVRQFDHANMESSRLFGIARDTMGPITSGTPEATASTLLNAGRKGASTLGVIRQELPKAADALAAAHVRQLGLEEPESAASVVSKKFDARWASLSPEAKAALVPDQTLRSRLDAAARIGGRMRAVGTREGSSGVATAMETLGGGTIAEQLAQSLGYLSGGQSAGAIMGPGAMAYLAGAGAPLAYNYARNRLANSATAATLLGSPGFEFAVRPALVGGASAANILTPPSQSAR